MSTKEELEHQITTICQSHLDGTYPHNWKYLVLDLQDIARTDESLFSENARRGLHYMECAIYNRMCGRCFDNRTFAWLQAFIEAWIHDRAHLPQCFVDACFEENCEGTTEAIFEQATKLCS